MTTDDVGVFVLAGLIFAGIIAVKTWFVMLLIGAVHADVLPAVHPIGFWAAIPIAILIHFVFTFDTNFSRD